MVGADGVNSVVRSSGDFSATVRRTGAVYLRGLVPVAGEGFAGECWTPSGLFGGAPVGAATQYFQASLLGLGHAPAVRAAVTARDLPALTRAWAAAFDAVERFGDLLVNEVVRVDRTRWADGRRVLLGDAAHAMAPRANSALVDAADRLVRSAMQEDPAALRGLVRSLDGANGSGRGTASRNRGSNPGPWGRTGLPNRSPRHAPDGTRGRPSTGPSRRG